MHRLFLAADALGLLASCQAGFGRVDGPYILDFIDIHEDANVCYELETGDCVQRIPQTVFAVGYNSEFIVAARHPHTFNETTVDRSKTEYFYIIRSLDGPSFDPERSVRGPFDLATFEHYQRTKNLPQFTREVSSLK